MEQEEDAKDTFGEKQEQEKEQDQNDDQQNQDINGDTPEQEGEKKVVGSVDINRGYVLSTFLINLALGQKLGLLRKRSLLLNQQDLEELSADLSYIIDVKIGV